MATLDVPPQVLLAGVIAIGVAYLYTLKKSTGILTGTGRAVTSGTRGAYRDVKTVYKTGYSDVAKPIGGQIKKFGGWLKRRVS